MSQRTAGPCLESKRHALEAVRHWDAFWRGENTRPAIVAIVPKPGVTPIEHPGWYRVMPGIDPAPVIDQLLGWVDTHDFLAEAFPSYYLEFAADHFAALLGADLRFSETERGGWALPAIEELAHADIRFERDGYWWRQTVELAHLLQDRCSGKLLIAGPSLVSNLDALAALYGAEKLLMAMVEAPDAVHRALEQIDTAHGEVMDALANLLDYDRLGSITRHQSYSARRCLVTQCDFSCMISAEMFEEFVAPYLRREMQRVDAVTYHLDGPGAIRHLDAVCRMPELGIVQWVPGAGRAAAQDWTALYARIDALGKGQMRGGSAALVKDLWQTYRDPRLFFVLQAKTRTEVEDCLGELEQIAEENSP